MAVMAIRFRCGSCAQPIEIDDEWATKTVACPYCRKTITAPAESTLTELDAIPTATPMTREESPSSQPGYPQPMGGPQGSSNKIAVVALILGILSIVSVFSASRILKAHPEELKEFEELGKADGDFSQKMEMQNRYIEKHPEILNWMVPFGLLLGLAGLCSLAAIICGIIGVRRIHRKGMALAGLIMATLVPLYVCSGLMLPT